MKETPKYEETEYKTVFSLYPAPKEYTPLLQKRVSEKRKRINLDEVRARDAERRVSQATGDHANANITEQIAREESLLDATLPDNLRYIEHNDKLSDISRQSFDEIRERVLLNRAYLNTVDWSKYILTLPDICHSEYQTNRLKFVDGKNYIRMVNRIDYCNKYLTKIEEFLNKSPTSQYELYFYGFSGCGKTHLLYQLACRLMADNNNIVVYVPKYNEDSIEFIIYALYYECFSTFCTETVSKAFQTDFEELEKLIASIESSEITDKRVISAKAADVITRIKRDLINCGKRLVFILDQTDKIIKNQKDESFKPAFDFLTLLLLEEHIVVFSASENNDVAILRREKEPERVLLKFDRLEFKAFVRLENPGNTAFIDSFGDEDLIEDILTFTGGIAFEINRFVNKVQPQSISIPDRFKEYVKDFLRFNSSSDLRTWYKDYIEKAMKELGTNKIKQDGILENMKRCFTGAKIDDGKLEYFDKSILVLIKNDEKNEYFIKPISPIARAVCFDAYRDLIQHLKLQPDFFSAVNDRSIGDNSRVLGYYIEDHIKSLLSLGHLKTLTICSYSGEVLNETTFKLGNLNIINFGGFLAPDKQFDTDKDTLFLPYENTYAGFDFILYLAAQKAALFVNVTIMENAERHIVANDLNVRKPAEKAITLYDVMEAWQLYLEPSAQNIRVYDVYLLAAQRFHEEKLDKTGRFSNVIFFESLGDDNQNLAYFSDYCFTRLRPERSQS